MADQPPKRQPTAIPVANRPQANVPSVLIEDPTPVGVPIDTLIERRTKLTQKDVNSTLTHVTLLRQELQTAIDLDVQEHKHLHGALTALNKRHDEIDQKVDELGKSNARAEGMLTVLVKNVEKQQDVMVHREKITVETQAVRERIDLEDKADKKKFRRQRLLKIIGIATPIIAAIATGITALLGKCG